jgi:hypothetical protein
VFQDLQLLFVNGPGGWFSKEFIVFRRNFLRQPKTKLTPTTNNL